MVFDHGITMNFFLEETMSDKQYHEDKTVLFNVCGFLLYRKRYVVFFF